MGEERKMTGSSKQKELKWMERSSDEDLRHEWNRLDKQIWNKAKRKKKKDLWRHITEIRQARRAKKSKEVTFNDREKKEKNVQIFKHNPFQGLEQSPLIPNLNRSLMTKKYAISSLVTGLSRYDTKSCYSLTVLSFILV